MQLLDTDILIHSSEEERRETTVRLVSGAVQTARVEADLTQELLALRIRRSRRLIAEIEAGRVLPPIDTLAAIAAACGVQASRLLARCGL